MNKIEEIILYDFKTYYQVTTNNIIWHWAYKSIDLNINFKQTYIYISIVLNVGTKTKYNMGISEYLFLNK